MARYEQLTQEELLCLLAERDRRIAELEERVRRLERLVSRNSGNSSMPPSSDDVPGRAKPAPKRTSKGSGRSRGKQPGADGAALSWVADPEETVPHRPDGRCGCGADLADAADVRIERSHQVHDLPPVKVTVTQHDVWRVRCGCGAEHAGELPPEVSPAPSSYGVNLKALVVYLIVFQHVPIQRCVRLIADLCGGSVPSTGFCHGMLARCAGVLADVVKLIKAVITAAVVAGFDETTLRAGPAGQKRYVLSASTDTAAAVTAGLAHLPRIPGPRSSTKQRPGRDLLEYCRDRPADVTRFSHDTRVWPTNNLSERDLRPTKTQQKISGRLTSEDITQNRLDIRSYIDTARKNGINVLTALRDALTGNPWTPAFPAPT